MNPVRLSIRPFGNSKGVVFPKMLLAQAGLSDAPAVLAIVEHGALVLRRPAAAPRTGWADAAKAVAERGGSALVLGEFGNADDAKWEW